MISLIVNGKDQTFDGDPSMPLVLYLRNVMHITSIRQGCLTGGCKSCMVYIDAARSLACMVTMQDVNAKSVMTAPEW